jgi:hypothetical protein
MVLVALGLAGSLASALAGRGGDAAARRTATVALAGWTREAVDGRARALTAVGLRVAALEAQPPEVLERALEALASADPALDRLVACGADGRILAVVERRPGAVPMAPGQVDPVGGRGRALAGRPAAPFVAGDATRGWDLGVAFPSPSGGAPAPFYLGATLGPAALPAEARAAAPGPTSPWRIPAAVVALLLTLGGVAVFARPARN